MSAAPPSDDNERLRALSRFVILDSATQDRLDRLCRTAAKVFGAPMSVISFVGKSQVWSKSHYGVNVPTHQWVTSFCRYTVSSDEVFVVEDARQDARFAENPLLRRDAGVRFYAGAPFFSRDGFPLGALAVMAATPRSITSDQQIILTELASMVTDALALYESRAKTESEERRDEITQLLEFAVYDALETGIAIIDEDGRLAHVNQAFADTFGYDTGELLNESFAIVLPPEARDRALNLHRTFLEGAPHPSGEVRARRRDGTTIDLKSAAQKITLEDGRRYRIWTVVPISEKREVERAGGTGEDQYRYVVNNAKDVIFQIDDVGRWIFLNRAWSDITGYDVEESIGRSFLDFVHPDDREECRIQYARFIARKVLNFQHELRLLTTEFGYRWVELEADVWDDVQGATLGATGSLRDITRRRQAEDTLKRREGFDALIRRFSVEVLNAAPAKVQEHIQQTLASIGEFTRVDRVHFTRIDKERAVQSRLFEWCAPGITSHLPDHASLPLEMMPWSMAQILKRQTIAMSDLSQLSKEAQSEREILKAQRVKSIVAVPVSYGGEVIGFAGCETVRSGKEWHSDIEWLLRVAGEVIISRVERQQVDHNFERLGDEYDLVANHSADLIAVLSPDGRIRFASRSFTRVLGFDTADLVGREFSQWIHPDDRQLLLDMVSAVSAKGGSRAARLPLRGKAGNWLNSDVTVTRYTHGNTDEILVVARETMPGYKVHEYVMEGQGPTAAILDHSPEMVAVLHADARIRHMNAAGHRQAGFKPEELLSTSFQRLLHGEDQPVFEAAFEKALAKPGSVVFECEVRLIPKEEPARHYSIAMANLLHEPAIDGVALFCHDISSQKEREFELIEARRKAEEVAKLNMMFLANMSHEIRTPLSAILGFASVLSDELSKEHKEFAEMIVQSGKRLMETLDSVLQLARAESDKSIERSQSIELVEEVRQAVKFLRPLADEKGLSLEVESKEQQVEAVIDKIYFHRILNNLIGNAVKYTHNGGVTIQLAADASSVFLSIRDTGIGMTEDYLSRVFEEFSQESHDPAKISEGSGLGLAITQRLVTIMNGTIKVESVKGEGSVFHVKLPRYPAGSNVEDASRDNPPASRRILAVDDNRMSRVLVQRILESSFNIDVATTAQEALERLQKDRYDLILLDINLGQGYSGLELLKQLRQMPGYENVPTVALTAYALPGDRDRFISAGFDYYLGKPYTRQELAEITEKILTSESPQGGEE